MNKNKRILFISALCPPVGDTTSTDIMTNNIIYGLKQCGYEVFIAAVCKDKDDKKRIVDYYSIFAEKVEILPSFFYDKMSPVKFVYNLYTNFLFTNKYKKQIKKYNGLKFDLIITNHVYSDEVIYGRCIKKLFPNIPYYQYWSDPMTLSGIIPESLRKNYKRWLFYFIEKKAISWADRIIYGTKPLMHFQKDIFKNYAKKMYYIDASYMPECDIDKPVDYKENYNKILYAGNYYKSIRNLKPLIDAIGEMPEYELDVYGKGDIDSDNYSNVRFKGRVSSTEIQQLEQSYLYSVCVLNHSCIQIPGKVFYGMMRKGRILIIADGKYADILTDYLKNFKRFILCKNDKESIKSAIIDNKGFNVDYKYVQNNYSPQTIALDLVNGGKLK